MAVIVKAGANSNPIEGLAGKTVCEVRAAFKGVFNIDDSATVTLNGRPAQENDVLREGDTLQFSKPLAQKGRVTITFVIA